MWNILTSLNSHSVKFIFKMFTLKWFNGLIMYIDDITKLTCDVKNGLLSPTSIITILKCILVCNSGSPSFFTITVNCRIMNEIYCNHFTTWRSHVLCSTESTCPFYVWLNHDWIMWESILNWNYKLYLFLISLQLKYCELWVPTVSTNCEYQLYSPYLVLYFLSKTLSTYTGTIVVDVPI